MKYCQDISVLVGEYHDSDENFAPEEIIRLYSPSFSPGYFLQWNSETQLFEQNIDSQQEIIQLSSGNKNHESPTHLSVSREEISWKKTHWKCLYGSIKILDRVHLIGVTSIENIAFTNIFRCKGLSWMQLPHTKQTTKNELEKELMVHYHALLDDFCVHEYNNLFGSFSHDVSKKYGKEISSDILGFRWNAELTYQFGSTKYVVPLIYGFVESYSTFEIIFTLISRRSRYFLGTRYHTRGINKRGYAAATVETEIIVENTRNDTTASYVFHRGSLPVFWTQSPTGKYSPQATPNTERLNGKSVIAFKSHFQRLRNYYDGSVFMLSLLGNKNIPLVQKSFDDALNADFSKEEELFQYINFDFHKHCALMHFNNVWQLIDVVREEVDSTRYSLLIRDGASSVYQQMQNGVVRFNCVDCIDRTNYAQFIICTYVVRKILNDIEPKWSPPLDFLANMWQRNGRTLALQYVASNVLYHDAYPESYRSLKSVIYDGCQALQRYFKNHFTDGYKQDRLNIATREHYVDMLSISSERLYLGGDLHLLLTGGIIFSFTLALGNWYFGEVFVTQPVNEPEFFSRIFSGIWGGIALLLMFSGIMLREKLFSYPHSIPQ